MGRSRRLVLLEPGLASAVGHHSDVNACLLPALRRRGWQPELWADVRAADDPALAARLPALRPVLREAGYIDPRHWCDLPGSLHQAGLMRAQLESAASGSEPVAVWLAHSLVPFQLIALAQLLQRQPSAQVLISLMFAPGEVFAGQPELDLQAQRQAAELNTRSALAALALAARRGGHQLLLCAGSQQLINRYTSFCATAGLPAPQLHPSVVGSADLIAGSWGADAAAADGRAIEGRATDAAPEQVLLHWGERKPDKGRDLALAVLKQLLSGAPLPDVLARTHWCFHAASRQPPPSAETELLQRARQHPRIRVLEGPLPRPAMLQELGHSRAVLLPYCPLAYAERSSGVLWLYGAARLARRLPARVVGHSGGWLAAEVPALGLHWQPLTPSASAAVAAGPSAAASASDAAAASAALSALELALQALPGPALVTPYGQQVLGQHWGDWLADLLDRDRADGDVADGDRADAIRRDADNLD
ncbi:MAG: hypothetical protein VKM92_04105 [Cyanobacteriota bacterium]|nr:hypothetical protein [Cyanobacteriota bacterium]